MGRLRWLGVVTSGFFSAFLCGCGGGSPPTVSIVSSDPSVLAGGTDNLTASVTNMSSATFTWSVNGVPGGNSTVGTIAGSGSIAIYTAPMSVPGTPQVTIEAAVSTSSNVSGSTTITVQSAGLSANVADRFLEQTTFGPTSALIAQVEQTGLQNYLTNQFNMPVTVYADPAASETNLTPLQQRYFVQLITAPDQLRQRVAFALAQIFVIAGDKINTPQGYTPYLNLLENDAFTNYRQIMQDVTLSPAMGHYLDMVNNDKPNTTTGTHADENYARETMQLFSIGLSELNEDGSVQISGGAPIPTYTQDTVEAFARAYTGWTYPTMPGATLQKHNPAYWTGPMVAFESNHDETVKQLLTYSGVANSGSLAAGQTAEQDLSGAMDNIFNHPNVPPFVALRLVQHLVTSNPSPAYIQRVADVFKNNGSGVRGDMKAVITAILMDPEARRGDSPATAVAGDGHLQEPILFMTGLLRAFGATTDGANLAGQGSSMGENALFSPSVFNFYSPFFATTTGHPAPEFQLLTTATALARANWVNTFAFGSIGTTTTIDFSGYGAQAASPSALLANLNTLMMHGTMSADMQNSILTAMQSVPAGSTQGVTQAKTAIYLIASSSQYQVYH
ncbi:MAG TPA: DUF1800 family protein [Candidatus Acidoferrum sp.]|jgi:uncharacterized protein (DUF1800 family)|nr:DUF1800 family protein [Candidatus Acidoferrum sp.]